MAVSFALFSEFGSFEGNDVTIVEDRPTLYATKMSAKNVVFGNIWIMVIFSQIAGKECVADRVPSPTRLRKFDLYTIAQPSQ